jgi:GAF domain-containing protein
LSAAVKARKAMIRGSEDAMTARYTSIGCARSLVVAPVLVAGRTLAILEMVNPNDGAPYTQDEANAMTYIAEQFAEFLSSRGLVFDHGRAGR